jgi:hypothetical protein
MAGAATANNIANNAANNISFFKSCPLTLESSAALVIFPPAFHTVNAKMQNFLCFLKFINTHGAEVNGSGRATWVPMPAGVVRDAGELTMDSQRK